MREREDFETLTEPVLGEVWRHVEDAENHLIELNELLEVPGLRAVGKHDREHAAQAEPA